MKNKWVQWAYMASINDDRTSLNERKETADVKQIYLLCRECDGSMVDAQTRACDCGRRTESRDFLFCFACALTKHRCQNCGQHVEVSIASC